MLIWSTMTWEFWTGTQLMTKSPLKVPKPRSSKKHQLLPRGPKVNEKIYYLLGLEMPRAYVWQVHATGGNMCLPVHLFPKPSELSVNVWRSPLFFPSLCSHSNTYVHHLTHWSPQVAGCVAYWKFARYIPFLWEVLSCGKCVIAIY